jgi:hypothetical protein
MPFPYSLHGAGPSEVAQAVRVPVRRVHLALRRCRQRPSIDRWALDFRQSSLRHVTRVSPSNSFSVFSPFSALSAGSCPLALSGSGKPLTQGSPLNPSHLRWGYCMNYCGAPDAGGSQVQRVVRYGLDVEHYLEYLPTAPVSQPSPSLWPRVRAAGSHTCERCSCATRSARKIFTRDW